MSCEDCEKAWNDGTIYPYRWKNVTIGVIACKKHVKEIFDMLNLLSKIPKSLPKRIIIKHGDFTDEDYAYAEGWNDCLKEVRTVLSSIY